MPDQPIFYPVTNEDYASLIARDWSMKYNDDHRSYVTKFHVKAEVANSYDRKIVGGRECEELWVPAEELDAFNAAIFGQIEVIAEFS